MSATRLILIRHTQPSAAARGRCYGVLDFGLSARGLRHARHIARTLDAITLHAVYTSPRLRARHLAEPLARLHGLDPIIDENLRELDFGDLEGMTYEEIERQHPGIFRRWMATPTEVKFPGGDSYRILKGRALAALAAIRARHNHETVAVVTHAGTVRAIVAECLSLPDHAIFRLDQSYGAISIIDWVDENPIVRLLNGQASMVARKRRGFLPSYEPTTARQP